MLTLYDGTTSVCAIKARLTLFEDKQQRLEAEVRE